VKARQSVERLAASSTYTPLILLFITLLVMKFSARHLLFAAFALGATTATIALPLGQVTELKLRSEPSELLLGRDVLYERDEMLNTRDFGEEEELFAREEVHIPQPANPPPSPPPSPKPKKQPLQTRSEEEEELFARWEFEEELFGREPEEEGILVSRESKATKGFLKFLSFFKPG